MLPSGHAAPAACPEMVPFEEVADVLARAASGVPGGPPAACRGAPGRVPGTVRVRRDEGAAGAEPPGACIRTSAEAQFCGAGSRTPSHASAVAQ